MGVFTSSPDDRGPKPEELDVSKTSPLCDAKPTSIRRPATSLMGQRRHHVGPPRSYRLNDSGAPAAVGTFIHQRSKSNDDFGRSPTVVSDIIERMPDFLQIQWLSTQPV